MITLGTVFRGCFSRVQSFSKLKNCCHYQLSPVCSSNSLLQRNFLLMAKSVPASSVAAKPQQFDYFLVLDFEATCDDRENIHPQEIIEFPVLKVNSKTLETESIFHHYVEPDVHNKLTSFCIELTGIVQDMVDGRPHITEVLKMFDKWMQDEGLLKPDASFAFVTCGDWDLRKMLPSQCDYLHLPVTSYFKKWINIKKAFAGLTGTFPRGMQEMLTKLSIPHQGRHHSGIDDCKNIANILTAMIRRGYVFKITGSTA
ncbi:hypothetical protein CHS0354_011080 [Potamilus streckersoni]|uniref:Exonuclease domain-containing protein n=1 Tax=Potamilus streckersoni TaxID=2493646 RepID=A0AAE0WG37_9BIVA|nr:hypothetical protein CHS0354_011080 [Potamilus streckersoni]